MGRSSLPSLRGWPIALLIAALAAIVYVALPTAPAEIVFQWVAWGSVGVLAINVRRRRSLGWQWWAIVAGIASFAIGDALFALYEFAFDIDPYPSVADLFYVAGYPLLAVGIGALAHRSHPHGDRVAVIDAGIVAIPAVVLAWLYLIEPKALAAASPFYERAVSAAYPAGDVLLLAVLLRLLLGPMVSRRAANPALPLLTLGFVLMLAADTWFAAAQIYGHYVAGSWNDGLFLAQYVVIAAASTQPSVVHIGEPAPRLDQSLDARRLTVLAIAALVMPTILAI